MAYRGIFVPTNPERWYISESGLGRGKIEYRSLWERKFMVWADRHPSVSVAASEEVVIPYRSPIDGKIHRYYMDMYIKYTDSHGVEKERIIEIKPHKETKPPRKKKNQKRYLNECKTYAVNMAKWDAAKKYADSKGMEFVIFTEYELGIKTR